MDRDSGIIDLFAIHKEEEQRVPAALPSTPPVSFDTNVAIGEDADVDGFAFAQAKSKKKAKILGGVIGGLAVVGILIAAVVSSGGATKEPAAAAAAPPPPPAATETLPAPAVTPAPTQAVNVPAPPPTAKSDDSKGGYDRSQAIAAYKKNQKAAAKAAPKSSGVKLQKVTSSGTN